MAEQEQKPEDIPEETPSDETPEGDAPELDVEADDEYGDADIGETAAEIPSGEGKPTTDEGDRAEDEGGEDDGVFSDELLIEAGLSRGEAEAQFKDPAALNAAMDLWARKMTSAGQQQALWQEQQQQAVAQQQQQQQQQANQPPQGAADPADAFRYPLKFEDPDEWDPEVRKHLEGMNDWYAKQLTSFHQQTQAALGSMMQERHAEEGARSLAEFDDAVNGLPDSFKMLYGEGRQSTMNPRTTQYAQRAELASTVISLQQQRTMAGLPAVPVGSLVRRAAAALNPKVEQTAVQGEMSSKLERRRGQFVSRPTHRKKRPETGVKAAVAAVGDWYAQHGLPTIPAAADEVDDGL